MDQMLEKDDIMKGTALNADKSAKEKSNLLLFAAGKLVSLLGTYIYSFAISLYILKVTGSGTSFAFSIMIGTLPRVLFGPIAGSLTDRVNRKKMIVILDIFSGCVVLSLLILSMNYGLRLPFIYSATFLLAVISTFFNTCFSAAIPRLVSDQKLVKINSYSRAIDSGSQILGPVLAGLVFSMISMKLFLLVNGISFILSATSELFIDFNFNMKDADGNNTGAISMRAVTRDVGEVFRFIHQNKLLSLIMPFSIAINFIITASISVVLPFLLNNTLGLSSSQYGAVEGSFSVGMLIAAIVIGKRPEKQKKRTGMAFGLAGMGVSLALMGIPGLQLFDGINRYFIFVMYIILSILFALLLLMVDLPMTVVIQRSIPDHMMGRVMGVWSAVAGSLTPVGIILAGFTLDILPAYLVFFTAGTFFCISALILCRSKSMENY